MTYVNVDAFLNEELDYSDITNVFWTDGTVVIGYIANDTSLWPTGSS